VPVLHYATLIPSYVAKQLAALFVPLHSHFSAASLLSALAVAVAFTLLNRRVDKRRVRYPVMFRAIFPSWLYRSASFRADVGFLLFSALAYGALFGWALFSSDVIAGTVGGALIDLLGANTKAQLSGIAGSGIVAVSIFIAYELAYWLDHYLSHRIPVLWEFHRVHHTAEVLSPLTNFRVHPVDSIVFTNILAVFIGTAHGVLRFLNIGNGGTGGSVIAVAGMWILGHLHHSHLWISFTGPVGHVILSPAHHQIHHSDNPKHFDKNFGAFLSIWDWMFGTLYMPERRRERLVFGVGHFAPHEHTVVGGMLMPFVAAWKRIRPSKSRVSVATQRASSTPTDLTMSA
jgi:sterol desaturase/sphingolipid hydroxylase (fatty acid hydroxylase superfamily)